MRRPGWLSWRHSLLAGAAVVLLASALGVGATTYLYERFVAGAGRVVAARPLWPAAAAAPVAGNLPPEPAHAVPAAARRELPPEAALTILVWSYPLAEAGSAADIRVMTEWLESAGFRVYYADVDLGSRGRWQRVLAGAYTDSAVASRRRAPAGGGAGRRRARGASHSRRSGRGLARDIKATAPRAGTRTVSLMLDALRRRRNEDTDEEAPRRTARSGRGARDARLSARPAPKRSVPEDDSPCTAAAPSALGFIGATAMVLMLTPEAPAPVPPAPRRGANSPAPARRRRGAARRCRRTRRPGRPQPRSGWLHRPRRRRRPGRAAARDADPPPPARTRRGRRPRLRRARPRRADAGADDPRASGANAGAPGVSGRPSSARAVHAIRVVHAGTASGRTAPGRTASGRAAPDRPATSGTSGRPRRRARGQRRQAGAYSRPFRLALYYQRVGDFDRRSGAVPDAARTDTKPARRCTTTSACCIRAAASSTMA